MAIDDNFELANRRAKDRQAAIPRAIAAHYDRASGRIVIHLSSNLDLSFSPRDAQGLENAKPSQLEEIKISPSGFGIHFPKLDADLYLPAVLEGFFLALVIGWPPDWDKLAANQGALLNALLQG